MHEPFINDRRELDRRLTAGELTQDEHDEEMRHLDEEDAELQREEDDAREYGRY